ncbi:MAG: hypothetical protein QOE33_917 [Acidobacteriota bacterium]|nr:hypothetical protein [Acidobacteriota bacterium]
MSGKKIFINSTLIAALSLGAAIPTSAQKKRATTATRKHTTTQSPTTATTTPTATTSPVANTTTNEPAPAKKNARAADVTASQSSVAVDTSVSAKKNADAAKNVNGPRYFYEFTQPDFDVRHVHIEHDAAGRGTLTFERKNEEQPFTEPLEISPSAFARIVSAWEALKFLDSQESYQSDKHFANLGVIRLTMKQGTRERTAQFDWTNNDQVAALKREYQRLTDQQLFVFDMEIARQYQPSETVRILKRLEILLDRDDLSDNSRVAPLLSDLSTDERLPLIARNHATRLLKRIEKEKK